MKKPNPLRTEAAIRRAMKLYIKGYCETATYVHGGDVVFKFWRGFIVIAELSVNDYLRKAPYKKGIKKAIKILKGRK